MRCTESVADDGRPDGGGYADDVYVDAGRRRVAVRPDIDVDIDICIGRQYLRDIGRCQRARHHIVRTVGSADRHRSVFRRGGPTALPGPGRQAQVGRADRLRLAGLSGFWLGRLLEPEPAQPVAVLQHDSVRQLVLPRTRIRVKRYRDGGDVDRIRIHVLWQRDERGGGGGGDRRRVQNDRVE